MSQVLNVQDEVIDGEAKYIITDNSDGTKNIKLANEVVNEGTVLNRTLFNKIDLTTNYRKVNGEYNNDTYVMNYTHDYFNEKEVVDGQRVLINRDEDVSVYEPDAYNIIRENTESTYYRTYAFKLSNSNILKIYNNIYNVVGFTAVLYNSEGTYISKTEFSDSFYFKTAIQLSNNNILLIGWAGSSNGYLYYMMIDEELNIVKSLTSVNNYGYYTRAIEMSNGNIMIFHCHDSNASSSYNYITILTNTGTIVKTQSLGDNLVQGELCEISNGNILICGSNRSTKMNYIVVDNSGNIVHENTNFYTGTDLRCQKIIPLNDEKTLMFFNTSYTSIGTYVSNGRLYYSIFDNNSNENPSTPIALSAYCTNDELMCNSQNIIKLKNGNIIAIASTNQLFDTDGNVTALINESSGERRGVSSATYAIETSLGNIIAVNNYINVIRSKNGYVFDSKKSSNYYLMNTILELDNGNIALFSYTNSCAIIELKTQGTYHTINNIPIDTSLIKGINYELTYDEESNKFIAEERS